ncbi:hypothetical protein H9P43_000199 [Blastocladiella emersonii ATCC 22665]|nr:hypothetical protein H9P43_000199 [Blastocladiella emersonii ATCC 22665]
MDRLAPRLAAVSGALAAARAASSSTIKWKYRQVPPREAAVMLPLCRVHHDPADPLHVLFTVRSPKLRAHRGEVSFPGGMRDASDASLAAAAAREVHEELGVAVPHEVESEGDAPGLIGTLSALPDKSLTIAVHPVVGYLGDVDLATLPINPGEVGAVFSLPLAYLLDPSNMRKYAPPPAAGSAPGGRKLSLGRAVYWRVPDDTPVYLPGGRAIGKHEFLNSLHDSDEVLEAEDTDGLDVWYGGLLGLTAFITKEFVERVNKYSPAAAANSDADASSAR